MFCNRFPSIPVPLLLLLLISGLSFHLLHLNGVGFSPPHVQFMVAHAQCQDALVDTQSRCIKHKVLKGENTQCSTRSRKCSLIT